MGNAEGDEVGVAVGAAVGDADGVAVGAADGADVGDVGVAVGSSVTSHGQPPNASLLPPPT